MAIAALLDRFIALLEEERLLLGKTLADADAVTALQQITEQKSELLQALAQEDPAEVRAHEDAVKTIQERSQVNMLIAQSNMLFIEDVFAGIFKDSTPQYNENGAMTAKKEGLFNKKI